MMYNIYAIRDVKTGFMTPTTDLNDEAARRNFIHAVWNTEGVLHSFCSDFDLYCLGQYDTDSGAIVPETAPVHILSGADALRAGASHGGEPSA